MKRTLILALSAAGALGAYAQGTVNFAEVPGTIVALVYAPQTATPTAETTGNSSADTPAGSATYTGGTIGGSAAGTGPTGYANGNNYTAELYGAGGTTATTFSQLSPLVQYTSTFSTKAQGTGFFIGTGSPAGDPGIPNSSGGSAVLSLAAWYSNAGQYPTLAAAEAANVPYGWSPLFTVTGLGNLGSPPSTPPNLTGLQSFSLITPGPIPEPGTIALGVMGAAAFLARRRNSK